MNSRLTESNSDLVPNMKAKINIEESKVEQRLVNDNDSVNERALILSNKKFSNPFDEWDETELLMKPKSPFMTFLVPASVLPQSESNIFEGIDNSNDSPQWVEIGCQIHTARVVTGVDFIGSVGEE